MASSESRLQESESKRAALIAEVSHLKMRLDLQRSAARTLAPTTTDDEVEALRAQLRKSEEHRSALVQQLDRLDSFRGAEGTTTLQAVPLAEDVDFAFEEEESARLQAEEVMKELVKCLSSKEHLQHDLHAAQLDLVEVQSQLDMSKERERSLSEMVRQYSATWSSGLLLQGTPKSVSDREHSPTSLGRLDHNATLRRVDNLVADGLQTVGKIEAVRRHLTAAKLEYLERENSEMKEQLKNYLHSSRTLLSVGLANRDANMKVSSSTQVQVGRLKGGVHEELMVAAPSSSMDALSWMKALEDHKAEIHNLHRVVQEKDCVIMDMQRLLQLQINRR